jgi:hypothetical protein
MAALGLQSYRQTECQCPEGGVAGGCFSKYWHWRFRIPAAPSQARIKELNKSTFVENLNAGNTSGIVNSRLALTASLTCRQCQKLVRTDLLIPENLVNKFLESRITGNLGTRTHFTGYGVYQDFGFSACPHSSGSSANRSPTQRPERPSKYDGSSVKLHGTIFKLRTCSTSAEYIPGGTWRWNHPSRSLMA